MPLEFGPAVGSPQDFTRQEREAPSLRETASAAFNLENDMVALGDLLTRETPEIDPLYDPTEDIAQSEFRDDYRDVLAHALSRKEFLAIEDRLREEVRLRDVMARSGWAGIVWGMGAGLISPTIFLPIAAPGRGIKATASAFGYAAAAAGAQEAVLYSAQETRTVGEVALGIGTATVLGGLLGSAAVYLRRGEFDRVASDMATAPGSRTILESAPQSVHGEAVPLRARGTQVADTLSALGHAETLVRARGMLRQNPELVKVLDEIEAALPADTRSPGFVEVELSEAVQRKIEANEATFFATEGDIDAERILNKGLEEVEATAAALRATGDSDLAKVADDLEAEATKREYTPEEFETAVEKVSAKADEADDAAEAVSTAGAAQVVEPVSGMKYAYGLGRQLAKVSTGLRTLEQTKHLPFGRKLLRDLSDFGVRMADNIEGRATSAGGTIENNVKTWHGRLYRGLVRLDELYADYMGSPGQVTRARLTSHAMQAGLAPRAGRMTRAEFNEAVTRAMWSNDTHPVGQVAQAAQFIRAEIYDPLGKAAASGPKPMIDPKFFEPDPVTGEKRTVIGADSYLNRLYNTLEINRDPIGFVDELTKFGVERMEADFQVRLDKALNRKERLLQEAEDLSLEEGEAQKLIEELKAELEVFEGADPTALARSDEVDYLKALAKDEADEAKAAQLRADAKEMENLEDVSAFRRQRGAVRRRLRTLARSAGRVSERRREKLERVEKIEAEQLKALERVVRAAVKAEKEMAKVSDENLDAQARRLLERLTNEGRLFDKNEEQLVNLVEEELGAAKRAKETALPGEVKVKLSAAAAEEIERLFPEEFVKLGLKAGTSTAPAHQMRELAVRMEGLITSGDLTPARRKAFTGAARKIQDSLGELRDPDLSEAVAIGYKLDEVAARQAARTDRMQDLARKLEDVEVIDREQARLYVQAVREDAFRRVNDINSRKAVRQEKLRAQAEDLDPKFVRERAAKLREEGEAQVDNFLDALRQRGIVDVDLEKRTADFTSIARERAIILKDKITGNAQYRLTGMDVIADKRGPELARTLAIPSERISKWLEMDIETNMRAYVRTMAPDVEIHAKWGDANGAEVMSRLGQDFQDSQDRIIQRRNAGEISEAAANKQIDEIKKEYDALHHTISALMARLKHQRGLPTDANGFGYRAAKVAMDLNTLRLMGGVAISSIPDIARPVMKYGLMRTFRDGWRPLVASFKEFRAVAREAQHAGTALDVYLAGRASAMFDIWDDVGRFSMAERAINWSANRIGNVALFNQWTSGMKFIAAGVANGKLWDELEVLASGKGNVAKATEFLADSGIDESNWRKLWQQVQDGNVKRVNGVWLPNTADWADANTIKLYQQYIAKQTDDTIITPGLERPLLADESVMMKLIFQFRSFMLSSNTKMMIAGLQEPDRALANGVLLSLAMGALGYWSYSMAAGGETKKRMLAAGPDKWADEAIARSGLLGVFAEAQRVGERMPGLNHIATFSGERTTRRGGEDLIATVLGPSYSLAKNGFGFLAALEEPTESTLHKLRLLTPYQNVWYLRNVLDQVEKATADQLGLPETRR